MHIRPYKKGDGSALLEVFRSAVRLVASQHYTPEQIAAWAPDSTNAAMWETKIANLNPFVAELNDAPVGYADLQDNGYIDHFYVSGHYSRQGIGSALMTRLLEKASRLGLAEITSDVSHTARPFFEKFGFVVVEQLTREVGGVEITNVLMRRRTAQKTNSARRQT